MQKLLSFIALLGLAYACTPLQGTATPGRELPTLGTLGKAQKTLWQQDFRPIGQPHLEQALLLSVREVPFTKAQFKTYNHVMVAKGKKPGLVFVDSFDSKPTYLRLRILDKIALRQQMNGDRNSGVVSYIKNDADHGMVTQVSLVTDAATKDLLLGADAVMLCQMPNGPLAIKVARGKQRTFLNPSDVQVFGYELSGFCWGKDRYGKPRVETLWSQGNSCPKGTEKDIQKLNTERAYLKL